MDLVKHLYRMREFSFNTFGPGERAARIVNHIRKELVEIEEAPKDLEEWVDVAILALDGAWRAGYSPEQIAAAIEAKQTKNEGRRWPDWQTVPEGEAIEHIKPALAGTREFLVEQETVPKLEYIAVDGRSYPGTVVGRRLEVHGTRSEVAVIEELCLKELQVPVADQNGNCFAIRRLMLEEKGKVGAVWTIAVSFDAA